MEQLDRLIEMAEEQMAPPQPVLHRGHERIARTEPNSRLYVGNTYLRLTEKYMGESEFVECGRIIVVDGDRSLRLDARFVQRRSIAMARCAIASFALRAKTSPSNSSTRAWSSGRELHHPSIAATRTVASPILASAARGPNASARSKARCASCKVAADPRPVKQRPAAHHEIVRIGIGRLFLLDPAAYRRDEFEVQGPCQTRWKGS
jgi:hypothetical protein